MRASPLIALIATGIFLSMPSMAQTTGKIAGRVVEAATGEPLPGVNISIEGTTRGTVTDVEGEYTIIGVRPGVHTIVASFVGFATQRREGVQVSVDLTTTVDFELTEEVIEGEEVVVTAEAVRVRKDLTSSEARVTAESIDRLPVQDLSQVLEVQAGVTQRGGQLHIRGGRASEITVMVDGVPVTDAYDGSTAIQLENAGIQELQVISGTFNAEYGNAMSGVINVVTKEGRPDRIGGSVEVYSGSYLVPGEGGKEFLLGVEQDRFTSQGIPYRDANVYSYLPINATHYYNLAGSLEGPVLTNRITFFGHARYFNNDGWLYGANIFDMDGSYGDSTLVPMNTYRRLSWQGNLRLQLTRNMIVNLIGLGSDQKSRPYDVFWRWAPNGRTQNFDNGTDLKLKFTHLLGSKAFYTLNVATFWREAESYLFEDPFSENYNDLLISPDSIEVQPGVWIDHVTGGGRYARGGTHLGRFNRTTRSYFASADLTSQLFRNHLVKVGLEGRLDRLDFISFNLIPDTTEGGALLEPFRPAIPPITNLDYQFFEDVQPISGSAYIQDKMEFESFIVNAGLRIDYFDSRATIPADPDDPNIYNPFKKIHIFHDLNGDGVITPDEERDDNRQTLQDREAYWWTKTEPKFQISPRLGVAYPITAEGVIHFSYGHFLQIPTLNRLFDNYGYKIPNRSGQYGPFGNPDLDAQKTVMYEIGMRQGVGDLVFDVTGYYRDVRDWVSTSRLIETELPGVTYVVFANRDYANTRGVTLSVNKQYSDNYAFDLNYTFQVAEGSASDPSEQFFAAQNLEQPKLALLPLGWDQRHKVAGSIFVGRDHWGASALAVWGSGFPYTPSFPEAAQVGADVPPEFPTNSRRIPSSFQVDLSAHYELSVAGVRPRLFLQIYNVLDNRNPVNVFADTGQPDITFVQPFGSVDPGYFVRPEFYSEPRRMHLGLELKF